MSVYKKLNAVRLALHSMELKKTGYNSFGKWHYFELADFLVPALKLFEEHGLCGIVSSNDATMRLDVREIEGDGSVTFAIPLSSAELKGAHAIQNLGAVITYSRRYLWTLALEILEHDAIDAAEPLKAQTEKPAPAKSVAKADFDSLPMSKQVTLREASERPLEQCEVGDYAGAFESIEALNLDNDDKVAFWSLFASHHRSALKRVSGQHHKKAAQP